MRKEESCGTCKYYSPVDEDAFLCNCEESEYYWDYVTNEDYCGCHDPRNKEVKGEKINVRRFKRCHGACGRSCQGK